jgi:dUTP pyrophosphatase
MLQKAKLKIKNVSNNSNPEYAKPGDSGFDLRAWIEDGSQIIMKPLERRLIHTGLYFEIPDNYEIQVRSRSGLSLKQGLVCANSPGTIDLNFRNEGGLIMINLSNEDVIIENGDRIAQGVLCPVSNSYNTELIFVDEISTDTERSMGGFGHTGVK